MTEVPWDAAIPGPEPLFIPIMRASVLAPVRLIALGASIERVWLHWLPPGIGGKNGRTTVCTGKSKGCWCSVYHLRKEWYAYLGSLEPESGRLAIGELTVQAVRDCELDLTCATCSVRGRPYTLTRRGRRECSPVRVEFAPRLTGSERLPAPFDVRAALCRLWRVGEDPPDAD